MVTDPSALEEVKEEYILPWRSKPRNSYQITTGKNAMFCPFFEHTCVYAWWAHMHRYLSVRDLTKIQTWQKALDRLDLHDGNGQLQFCGEINKSCHWQVWALQREVL